MGESNRKRDVEVDFWIGLAREELRGPESWRSEELALAVLCLHRMIVESESPRTDAPERPEPF